MRPQLASPVNTEMPDIRPRSGSRFLGLVHLTYAIIGMTLYQDALVSAARALRGAPPLQAGDTEITNTISQMILLSGLLVFLWGYRKVLARAFRPLLPLLVLLALCFFSVLWSSYPDITMRRSVTLTICIFFGVYCYFQFGFSRTVELLATTTAVLAVLSLLVYFLLPEVGRLTAETYHNAMRGVYGQKNALGLAMLMAMNYWLSAIFGGRRLGLLSIIGVVATLACLVMSWAATSLAIFLCVIFLHLQNYSRRSWRLRIVVLYVAAIILFVIAVGFIAAPVEFLGLFNRDLSFTGRVPLWIECIKAWLAKPILGYGYAAFWNKDSVLVQRIWKDIVWEAPGAHNGYLDVLLQLGVVGFAVCLWAWLRVIFGALRAGKKGGFPNICWLVGFIFISVMINLDEGDQPSADEYALLLPVILLTLANVPRTAPNAAQRRAVPDSDLVGAAKSEQAASVRIATNLRAGGEA